MIGYNSDALNCGALSYFGILSASLLTDKIRV